MTDLVDRSRTGIGSVMPMPTVREFIDDHRGELLADLDQWLRIPGISAQPEHHADVQRSAEWFAEAARRTGLPTVEIWPTKGCPRCTPSGAATIRRRHGAGLRPPRRAAGRPDRVVAHRPVRPDHRRRPAAGARGVRRQGPVAVPPAGPARPPGGDRPDEPGVNLKFLIEGEEESGSPNFEDLLAERRDRLDCDVVVITDTGMLGLDMPSTVTGMRGLIVCTVDFHGPDLDLHSGSFGGAVPNPATAIARLTGALHDERGRVQIPGFYDDVLELTDDERDLFAKVPFDEAEFLSVAKSRALGGEDGYSTLERIGARPTAEVNGIWGGYMGAGSKTIVPTDAHVKLSFRLVANQDPDKILAAVDQFVTDHTPAGIDMQIEWEGDGVAPCLVPLGTPAYLALTDAISQAFDGAQVLPTREGGSGPEAALQQITRRAAGVSRGGSARRPDPRTEREGQPVDAVQGRRGHGAAVGQHRPTRPRRDR